MRVSSLRSSGRKLEGGEKIATKLKTVLAALLLFALTAVTVSAVGPLPQGVGQEYTVKAGDWLSKIAEKYYGDMTALMIIGEATNAKAAEDSSFATITDPDLIEVGQKLWIPGVTVGGEQAVSVAPVPQGRAPGIQQAYSDAIKDAEIAEPDEISRDLTAIVESNDDLVWKDQPGNMRVLVVTWTSWDGYDDQVGRTMAMSRNIWVTAVPELKSFCTDYTATQPDPTLRLEQILGLPPNNGKTKFVEIWVEPKDLFRPSPDPEITDHEAELTFPTSRYFTVSEDYVTWFNDLRSSSYGDDGYPWTRLGYTYDWGNPNTDVGLSEFIISEGATVEIRVVMSTGDYCQ